MLEVINRYKHGYIIVPVIKACMEKGVFDKIKLGESIHTQELADSLTANAGHLNVALRILESLGWVVRNENEEYQLLEKSDERFQIPDNIMELFDFPMSDYLLGQASLSLAEWIEMSQRRWESNSLFSDLLDGILIISLLLSLKKHQLLSFSSNKVDEPLTLNLSLTDPEIEKEVLTLFKNKKWVDEGARVSRVGQFIFDRIFIAATVASYKPMLVKMDKILFGKQKEVFKRDELGHEQHIDRTLNVQGSGFQHVKYFKEVEALIVSIFNQGAMAEQPKYIADMGCGNGDFLKSIYETIVSKTRRGKELKRYPIVLIGVDFNEEALNETAKTLENIEHLVLKGDIGDPAKMIKDLKSAGISDPENTLHIRSFLDHDRPFINPRDTGAVALRKNSNYRSVCVDENGQSIESAAAIQSLVEHLVRWSSLELKYGLIVLEVHSLAPKITAKFLDKSENLYFDAYHGFSKQYLVEAEAFLISAAEAGFYPRSEFSRKYPKTLPFSRISLNYFEKKKFSIRHPHKQDLDELTRLDKYCHTSVEEHSKVESKELIRINPDNQYVITQDGNIIAAAYSNAEESKTKLSYIVYVPDAPLEYLHDLLDFINLHSSLSPEGDIEGVELSRRQLVENYLNKSSVTYIQRVEKFVSNYQIASSDDTLEAEKSLEDFGTRWLLSIFRNMGMKLEKDKSYSYSRLISQLKILPKYERLFQALIIMLDSRGLLKYSGDQVKISEGAIHQALPDPVADYTKFKTQFYQEHPYYVAFLNLMERGLSHYDQVLVGKMAANESIFPRGSMDTFEAIFKGDKVSDYFNEVLAETILSRVLSIYTKQSDEKVRILEIGAGTGGATSSVLECLKDYSNEIDFVYTDISSSFVRYGKKKFSSSYPWVKFDLLNIERGEDVQRLGAGTFDIVYASNVLHDTKYMNNTLLQVRHLMKNDGLLVLNEFTRMKDLLLFTGGLLHGWWLFEDPENRLPYSCLLNVDKWRSVLSDAGFDNFNYFSLPFIKKTQDVGQSVLVAELNEVDTKEVLQHKEQESKSGNNDGLSRCESSLATSSSDFKFSKKQKTNSLMVSVAECVGEVLDENQLISFKSGASILELDLDSMESLELQFLLETKFNSKLEASFLYQYETIDKIVDYLRNISDENIALQPHVREGNNLDTKEGDIRSGIADSIAEILGDDRMAALSSSSLFSGVGLDSMENLELQFSLESKFNVKLDPSFLYQYESIDEIVSYFMEALELKNAPKQGIKSNEKYSVISSKVMAAFSEIIDNDRMQNLKPKLDFSVFGLDSMEILELQYELEKSFNVKLDPSFLLEYQTLDDVVGYFETSQCKDSQVKSTSNSEKNIASGNSKVSQLIRSSLGEILDGDRMTNFRPEAKLTELGLDSMESLELQSLFEATFQTKLEPSFLFQYETVVEIEKYFVTVLNQTKDEKANVDFTRSHSVESQQEVVTRKSEEISVNKIERSNPKSSRREIALHSLTFGQKGMWAMEKMGRGKLAHNVPLTIVLRGKVDRKLLSNCMQELSSRHEILRSNVVEIDGKEMYQVGKVVDNEIESVDLSACTSQEASFQVEQLKKEQSSTPFNLKNDYPVRTKLIKLNGKRHIFLLTLHHMVCDGWSIRIIFNELSTIYNDKSAGRKNSLKPLSNQYADFSFWQEKFFESEKAKEQLEFWEDVLEDVEPILNLPMTNPRTSNPTYESELYDFSIPRVLSDDLRLLSSENACTLYTTFLSAFSLLLHRYSGQNDIVVGSPTANRHVGGFHDVIGYFVNVLTFRTKFSSSMTFSELLSKTTNYNKLVQQNNDIPLPKLIEHLNLERNENYPPLIQVLFAFQNISIDSKRFLNSHFSIIEIETIETQFDLKLEIQDGAGEIKARFEYNKELFDRSYIERLSKHLLTLLEEISLSPNNMVCNYEFLGPAEKQLQLMDWNSTGREFPQEQHIHKLFEQQVKKSPNAVALVYQGQHLSYEELNSRSNRLAHYLLSQGIGPEKRVGIYFKRSIDMVISILGILKAGGCYIPLEPDLPAKRLAYIVADSGVELVLTHTLVDTSLFVQEVSDGLEQQKSKFCKIRCLNIDSELDISCYPPKDPVTSLSVSNLVYVIYTSGSTGEPKGVMIENHALTNRIDWMQKQYSLTSRDRILHKTPFSFDVSVWEFFWPLTAGASLEIAKPGGHKNPQYLSNIIQEKSISVLHFVPSMLNSFLSSVGWNEINSVRQVICSGEILGEDLQHQFFETKTSSALDNLYGPTEAAIDVSYWSCVEHWNHASVPIGKPIQNISLYVVDEAIQIMPVGCIGELLIGGVGLSRGYLNQESLTAEKFIPNPFVQNSGERLYRTGDLVRYLPDGNLEYIGRIDHQVKLRGFRIELAEIEAKLTEHPLIQSCAATVCENSQGESLIIAYCALQEVLSDEKERDHNSILRAFLGEVLPEYMIPNAFVMLKELPLSENGKINRKALPSPEIEAFTSHAYIAPKTQIEKILACVWAEVLDFKKEDISVTANFFALGGHSLLIMKVIAALNSYDILVDNLTVFDNPVLSELADKIDSSQEKKLDDFVAPSNLIPDGCEQITPKMLPLVNLSAEEINVIVSQVPGGAKNIKDIYSLAPMQEGVLFHHLMDKASDPYVLSMLFSVDNSNELKRYLDALQTVVDRHDVLRTAILNEDLSVPVQVVYRQVNLIIEESTLEPSKDIQGQLDEMLTNDLSMELSTASLMKIRKVADPHSSRWIVVMKIHHIITDHISLEIIGRELNACLTGQQAQLGLVTPYRDFVAYTAHQNDKLDAKSFFKNALGDISEPTLPFNLQDVHDGGIQITQARESLPSELAGQVRKLSQRLNVSPAVLFHVAWAIVVGRCSGRDDVVFGTVLSGRLQRIKGIEAIQGMFVNTLPLRIKIQDKSVHQLVAETDDALRELLVFEHVSLTLAQSCSGLASEVPLFSAMLNYRHSEHSTEEVGEQLKLGRSALDWQVRNNYPFSIAVSDQGINFSIEAKVASFLSAERTIGYVKKAIEEIVEISELSNDSQLAKISILPEQEHRYLIHECNNTHKALPSDKCLHELFEAQAKKTPEAVALIVEHNYLSYAELNRRSNQLAHYLISQGVTQETLVGICIERSADMMIALFAIWKAGGAYLPLDPNYPSARLNYMLKDSNVHHLLIQQGLDSNLELTDNLLVTTLDCLKSRNKIQSYPQSNPKVTVKGDIARLAYVIYTSGSTGNPKGTLVEHHGLSNYVDHSINNYMKGGISGSIVSSTLSFDATVTSLFPPLMLGKTVELLKNSEDLLHVLATRMFRSDIPLLFKLTPSHLYALEGLKPNKVEAHVVHHIVFGGESSSINLIRKWKSELLPNAIFTHHYGPTETVVGSSDFSLNSQKNLENISGITPPIGKPIQNTSLYVLDSKMSLMPIQSIGELYIGGVGLARGYLTQPALTAERFIPNPFSNKPDARMYKTGDLVRWLEDGTMEFIGRADNQVKIRGFRIELGEVEIKLSQCDGVKSSIAIAQEDERGEVRLVAYLIAENRNNLNESEFIGQIKKNLIANLPSHMVPSVFLILNDWPLMPNGKIDKQALPLTLQNDLQKENFVGPRNDIEKILCQFWQDILMIDKVGIHDNFFSLGGQSLLAMRLVSSIRREFKLEVSLGMLFNAPTIAELSNSFMGCSEDFVLPPIKPVKRTKRLPLSYAQQRLWFIDQFGEGSTQYNVPSHFTMNLAFNKEAFKKALAALLDRHEVLRTHFRMAGGEPLQIIKDQFELPYREHDLSRLSIQDREYHVRKLMLEEAGEAFNLSRDLMLRVRLIILSESEHVVLYTMHHIASDGWSRGILQNELIDLYDDFCKGDKTSLMPLDVQYADYSVWQREWLQGEVLDQQLQFWKESLKNVPVVHNLPLDKERPQLQTFSGEIHHQRIDKATTGMIKHLCEAHGVTVFMFLQTAFAVLVGRYSDEDDVLIGAPIAGRTHSDIESLIGFFVNTLVLRTDLSKRPTFRHLLKENKCFMLDAYAHQHIPFEMLVEELQPERHLSHNPIFQIVFAGQNNELGSLDISDRETSVNENGATQERQVLPFTKKMNTRFDLELHVYELDEEVSVSWVYNLALFEKGSISSFSNNYDALLKSIIEELTNTVEDELSISFLSTVAEKEKYNLLHSWNKIQSSYPKSTNICQFIRSLYSCKKFKNSYLKESSLFILDDNLQLVPVGVVGKLYIGGSETVAQLIKLFESKVNDLVSNKIANHCGGNLIKTGDFARWRADGSMVFSENDFLVKQKKLNSSMKEVATLLESNLLVVKATVHLKEVGLGQDEICAYLLVNEEDYKSINVAEFLNQIRRYVRNQEKVYLIPDVFVVLDKLPINSKGEPDHAALTKIEKKQLGGNIEIVELEKALRNHDSISSAVVTTQGKNQDLVVAHISPSKNYINKTSQDFILEHIAHWSSFYDQTYDKGEREIEAELNVSGWNSSYTDEPIAIQQMQEWCLNTVARINTLKPNKLLEIGCGTGLLLFRYAESCDVVKAIDISAIALQGVQRELDKRKWSHVNLSLGDALSFELEPGCLFDTVIINSVVPYMPNQLYLEKMIQRLLTCVEDGGKIFIGDVRNLDLHREHVVEVEKSRLTEPLLSREFSRRVDWRMQQEQELLVSPSFFIKLANRESSISGVDIICKRGIGDNEMARYRYEVVLTVGAKIESINQSPDIPWYEVSEVELLEKFFSDSLPKNFGVSGLSNPRVTDNHILSESVIGGRENRIIYPSKNPGLLSEKAMQNNLLLEKILVTAEERGYQCEVTWSQIDVDKIDLLFSKDQMPQVQSCSPYVQNYLVNHPKLATMGHDLSQELNEHLRVNLPDVALPRVYIAVEEQLLNSLEPDHRNTLPLPKEGDLEEEDYTPPRNEIERELCQIWQEVLRVSRVGIYDNFFVLGGHSLLATRLISLIRECFNTELQVRILFESPTIAELSTSIESTSEAFVLPPVVPIDKDDNVPLSFSQQRLWFIDKFEQGSAEYNAPGKLLFSGDFSLDAFQKSVDSLIERHEILRTTYVSNNGRPKQVINQKYKLPVRNIDLSKCDEKVRSNEVERLIKEEAKSVFDLTRDIMLRVVVIKLSNREHLILYTMHHIASDGWSMAILHSELSELYEAFNNGRPNPLTKLNVQYADYAVWQREWLHGEVLSKQVSYWKKQLADIPNVHSLPLDRPRRNKQVFSGDVYQQVLGRRTSKKIKEVASKNDTTVFILMQTVFAILVGRYSGENDIVMGTPIAGRNHKDIEGLIGFFVNTLVLRTDLSSDSSFNELLKRNKEMILDAYAHQDIPFDMLVDELQPDRSLAYSPIFQILFIGQSNERKEIEFERNSQSRSSHQLGPDIISSRFELEINLNDSGEEIIIRWVYNESLFEASTIERMANNYQVLLTSVIDNMQDKALLKGTPKVSELEYIEKWEKQKVVHDWNRTDQDFPQQESIISLFEKRAMEAPESIALSFQGEMSSPCYITYSELDRKASQLANYLISEGVGPEIAVGVCSKRSIEMLVGVLAILKAGAYYVPLDPDLPKVRMLYVIENSNVKSILTDSKSLASFSEQEHPESQLRDIFGYRSILVLDKFNYEQQCSKFTSHGNTDNRNLSYAIYTSGSTGKPKGVAIDNQAILNRLDWMQRQYSLGKSERVLQKTPFGFDVSVWEIFWPLTVGASLVIAKPEGHSDTRYLADLIEDQKVNILHFVPPMLDAFLSAEGWASCQSVRQVICSGDHLSKELETRFLLQEKNTKLDNLYGPTEAAIDVSYWQCTPESELSCVPIGKPIQNIQLYVVDKAMKPVAIGCIGELLIAGTGLSRGYINNSATTAESFIPNPFSTKEGERLYRTGDLVRYLSDGSLEIIGRLDHQVKIRGFRIELGDIENALSVHTGIKDVIVMAREDSPNNKQLVAYFIALENDLDGQVLIDEIRHLVEPILPVYMLPSAYVILESFPLTNNGKLDRKALPKPNFEEVNIEFEAPQGKAEELLASLWCELLNVKSISRNDNFFECGGHSLLATQLVSRIRDEFAIELAIRVLFENRTIETQVQAIENARFTDVSSIDTTEKILNEFQHNKKSLDDYAGMLDEGEI